MQLSKFYFHFVAKANRQPQFFCHNSFMHNIAIVTVDVINRGKLFSCSPTADQLRYTDCNLTILNTECYWKKD